MEKVGVFSFLLDPGHKDQKKKRSWWSSPWGACATLGFLIAAGTVLTAGAGALIIAGALTLGTAGWLGCYIGVREG